MDGAAGWVAVKRPFGGRRFQYSSATFTDARKNRIVVEAVEQRKGIMRRTTGYEVG